MTRAKTTAATTSWLAEHDIPYRLDEDGDVIVEAAIVIPAGSIVRLPALMEAKSVHVGRGGRLIAESLTEVSGSIYAHDESTFVAESLVYVSGNIDIGRDATVTISPLIDVSGYVHIGPGATFSD